MRAPELGDAALLHVRRARRARSVALNLSAAAGFLTLKRARGANGWLQARPALSAAAGMHSEIGRARGTLRDGSAFRRLLHEPAHGAAQLALEVARSHCSRSIGSSPSAVSAGCSVYGWFVQRTAVLFSTECTVHMRAIAIHTFFNVTVQSGRPTARASSRCRHRRHCPASLPLFRPPRPLRSRSIVCMCAPMCDDTFIYI